MRILVTGTEGYIGCLLGALLLNEGHDVIAFDTGYYMDGWLFNGLSKRPMTVMKDLRTLELRDLEGCDAVIHLAELSNDPAGQLNPTITYQINHKGTLNLARLARQSGVKRFVYTSSCSVYGVAETDMVDERSRVNPQTAYAECKVLVERDVGALATNEFSPVFLRNATAYGASPRMRFDLVLNNLAGYAWTDKQIKMTSDGSPWRPLVHIRDICKAIMCTLKADKEIIHNEIFNVGDSNSNYRVIQIAELVSEVFKGCKLSVGPPTKDNRSYRVNFDKINQQLPGFRCEWELRRGAEELYDCFQRNQITREIFGFRAFTRLHQLQWLKATAQIDDDFFWRIPRI